MALEIERRFLINRDLAPDFPSAPYLRTRIVQFFLSSDPNRVVRVRFSSDATPKWLLDAMTLEADPTQAFLTIKGPKVGGAGIEVETPITLEQAEALRPLAIGMPIDKIRYRMGLGNALVAEVDFFESPSELAIVEVEFKSAASARAFQPLPWFGKEITDDPSYSNQSIALGLHRV